MEPDEILSVHCDWDGARDTFQGATDQPLGKENPNESSTWCSPSGTPGPACPVDHEVIQAPVIACAFIFNDAGARRGE